MSVIFFIYCKILDRIILKFNKTKNDQVYNNHCQMVADIVRYDLRSSVLFSVCPSVCVCLCVCVCP